MDLLELTGLVRAVFEGSVALRVHRECIFRVLWKVVSRFALLMYAPLRARALGERPYVRLAVISLHQEKYLSEAHWAGLFAIYSKILS